MELSEIEKGELYRYGKATVIIEDIDVTPLFFNLRKVRIQGRFIHNMKPFILNSSTPLERL